MYNKSLRIGTLSMLLAINLNISPSFSASHEFQLAEDYAACRKFSLHSDSLPSCFGMKDPLKIRAREHMQAAAQRLEKYREMKRAHPRPESPLMTPADIARANCLGAEHQPLWNR